MEGRKGKRRGGRGRREREWGVAASGRGGGGKRKGGRGTERGEDEEKRKKGGEESWNRAADWLRPALVSVFCATQQTCAMAVI